MDDGIAKTTTQPPTAINTSTTTPRAINVRRRTIRHTLALIVLVFLGYNLLVPQSHKLDFLSVTRDLSSEDLTLFLDKIQTGKLFNTEQEATWRRPYGFDGEYLGVVEPVAQTRCKVHTFYDFDQAQDKVGEELILKTWKRAWWAQGFEPVVLTPEDCKNSPMYKEFMNSRHFTQDYKKENRKWFAWSGSDAGIMMNYRVIPMNLEDEDTIEQLKNCKFDYPSHYYPLGLEFVHSGVEKSLTVLKEVMRMPEDDEKKADNFIVKRKDLLSNYFDYQEQDFVAFYSPKDIKKMTDGKEFNASEVATMMNVHMHHEFMHRYPLGLAVIDPFKTSAFSAEARDLGSRLQTCDDVDSEGIEHSCPPTRSNLELADALKAEGINLLNLGEDICGNPCVRGSGTQNLKVLSSLPLPDEGYYSIITVVHPMTALAMYKDATVFTKSQIQQHQNELVLRLTAQTFPKSVNLEYRLLYIKDAIYQLSSYTNMTWLPWERVSTTGKVEDEIVEWDLGFDIPKSGGYMATNIKPILEIRDKLMDTNGQDAQILKVEAISKADSELYKFLDAWTDKREDLFHELLFETKSLLKEGKP